MKFEIVKKSGKSPKKEKVDLLVKTKDGWSMKKKDLPLFEVSQADAEKEFLEKDVRILRAKRK